MGPAVSGLKGFFSRLHDQGLLATSEKSSVLFVGCIQLFVSGRYLVVGPMEMDDNGDQAFWADLRHSEPGAANRVGTVCFSVAFSLFVLLVHFG